MGIFLKPNSPLALFVRSFLPDFSKSTVTDQISVLKTELQTKTLPPYISALEVETGFHGKEPFKSKWAANTNNIIMGQRGLNLTNREFKLRPQNMIEIIHEVLNTMSIKLTELETMVNKSFGDSIVNSQLTYHQANLLRLVEMTEFFLIYSRRLLINIINNEYKYLDSRPSIGEPFVKGDLKWLESNLGTYATMLAIYSQDKENFFRAIKSVPDLIVSDDKDETETALKVHGDNLDPFRLGFIPYVLNPIYHIRMAIVDWRHNRIEAAKAERELLELRIQQYIMKRNGTDNAKMDQMINNAQERLKRLNKKITDMEESYRVDYGA